MSLCLRLFIGFLFGVTFIDVLLERESREEDTELADGRARYGYYIAGGILPCVLLTLLVTLSFQRGLPYAMEMLFSFSLPIFLHIALYFILLSFLMPLLRRQISSRACAMLWLLPTYLYLLVSNAPLWPTSPWVVVSLSRKTAELICLVWLIGFIGVLGWKILSHFVFRHQVLRDAYLPGREVRQIWEEEVRKAGIKKPYRLAISPQVKTPLSVGSYRWTIYVLLPERTYSEEELSLIFRHELIHIGRADSSNKFFLVFCTAMCWFNPLMWRAMRCSAEDMELSCDETVLLDADEETRQRYANLLLRTAGDSRGFTTCLSASASSLRYRLKAVVSTAERKSGALVILGLFVLLVASFGYVAVGYEQLSGRELLFADGELSEYVVMNEDITAEEAEQLLTYLAGLEFEKITGNDHDLSGEKSFSVRCNGPDGRFLLMMTEEEAQLMIFGQKIENTYVRVRSEIDWDYLNEVFPPNYPKY